MELIRPGFGHDADHRAAVVAVLGGEAVVLQLELLNGFHRRLVLYVSGTALATLGIAEQGTVQPELRSRETLSIRGEDGTPLSPDRSVGDLGDSWGQKGKRGYVTVD